MPELTATGGFTVVTRGFIAYAENDPSEGRSGRREAGRFTAVDEAIEAARGRGVQGESGDVAEFETRLYEGGLVADHVTPLIGRRRTPDGWYQVGWLDLREYNPPPS